MSDEPRILTMWHDLDAREAGEALVGTALLHLEQVPGLRRHLEGVMRHTGLPPDEAAGAAQVIAESVAGGLILAGWRPPEPRPKRIQMRRTKGWRKPPGAVYVGRPSKWGNPFVVGQEYVRSKMAPGGGRIANVVVDNADAVRLYRRFTAREVRVQIDAYQELRGKDLACWCPLDQPCHADVLLELANRPESSDA